MLPSLRAKSRLISLGLLPQIVLVWLLLACPACWATTTVPASSHDCCPDSEQQADQPAMDCCGTQALSTVSPLEQDAAAPPEPELAPAWTVHHHNSMTDAAPRYVTFTSCRFALSLYKQNCVYLN